LVAEYRAESAGLRHDLAQQALIAELQATSSVFRQAWRSQKVLAREGGSRGFLVPKQGCRYFWQYSLRMSQQVDVKLIVLVPQ